MRPGNDQELNRGLDCVYTTQALAQLPRLLSLLDREALSASAGSFDRSHWGWKFRDFPLTMLQTGIAPLAMAWRFPFPGSPYTGNPQLLAWIVSGMERTLERQRREGAFDSVGPNTRDHGVTLAMVHYLAETSRLLGDALPSALRERLVRSVQRACSFSARSGEDYAFISNHQALFAAAWLEAAEHTGDASYRRRADEVLARILREQSPDGWYREYGGPDPGYESLGIHYLAKCWQRIRSAELLASLRRSIEFFAHCVHPDGSVGGVYGSRHTQLYFPSGFEMLAAELPMAAAVAKFMREKLERGNVLTPAASDTENLVPLLCSYLDAALVCGQESGRPAAVLPCETLAGFRRFSDSGIAVMGTASYYAVASGAKGGVCRIFSKHSERVAYEDAGYLVSAAGRLWTSQRLGQSRDLDSPGELHCAGQFSEVRQELPTPWKFLLLRLLNLTLFRSLRLGAWLRRRIIARLITSAHPGPLKLERRIRFDADGVAFEDRITLSRPVAIERLELARSFTAIHMGSAKYFHPSELVETPLPDTSTMAKALRAGRAAECRFRLVLSPDAEPVLVTDPAGLPARSQVQEEGALTRK
jgi:hypothetical protein